MPERIRAFAPATVANVGCGFDSLGFAVEGLGDEVTAVRRSQAGVSIGDIESTVDLPMSSDSNIIGIVAKSVLKRASAKFGVELFLKKGLGVGTGLGSSAASAAAAGYAVNELLDTPLSQKELLDAILDGEEAVSGRHADNAAPALLGGLVLITGQELSGLRVLPVPDGLQVVLVSPDFRLDTRKARSVLPSEVRLGEALKQSRNLAALVDACHRNDALDFLSAARDELIEAYRLPLIPGALEATQRCRELGYVATFLSGSGPTIAVLCLDSANIDEIRLAIEGAFSGSGLTSFCHVSSVGAAGARRLEPT
ncbi:MAG: homoserine kinase [Myxococcota bacterium]|nr:homoserine kinase [Myxococcota bacterium]